MIEGPYVPKPSCLVCSISGALLGMVLMFVVDKAGVVVEEKVQPVKESQFGSPVCPSGFWIGQRMDKWRHGKIVQSYWKHTCLEASRIQETKKSNNSPAVVVKPMPETATVISERDKEEGATLLWGLVGICVILLANAFLKLL